MTASAPRTLERGFTWAPEIQGDEMTTGVGGGTCQVSTTLHIAALFGALEILERQGHSHPSAYAMMGLDATVSYPSTDLKFKNTLPFPVMIHAYLPKPTDDPRRAPRRRSRRQGVVQVWHRQLPKTSRGGFTSRIL